MLIYHREAVELIKPVLNVNYSIGIIGCSLHTIIKDVRLMKEKKLKLNYICLLNWDLDV